MIPLLLLDEVEDAAAALALSEGDGLAEGLNDAGDDFHVAAAAHGIFHRDDGGVAFLGENAGVEVEGVFVNRGREFCALSGEFFEALFDAFGSLVESFELVVYALLGFTELGLSLFETGFVCFKGLHLVEFFVLHGGDLGLVAFDFVSEGGELVVFAGLELLVLKALDGGLTGLDVELDALNFDLSLLHRLGGAIHRGLVASELGLRPCLEIWDVLEVFL